MTYVSKKCLDLCERYLDAIRPNASNQPSIKTNGEFSDLLAPWTYKNEEFLELEIDRLFKPNWLLVGHVCDIPDPGGYLTFEGFGEKAMVVRNRTGELRAFHNICRHRGSQILNGEGACRNALFCPFHGWRYDFDGNLKFIPGRDGFSDIDTSQYSLVPVDLEVWNGFIFIRFQSGGISVKEQMQPVEDQIAEYRLSELQPYGPHARFVYPVNWKVVHDIDNEGYHVPFGHPSLQQLYGNDYVDTDIERIPVSIGRFNEKIGNLWSVKNYRKLMPDFEHLPEQRKNMWFYVGKFPNLVFALYPDLMEIYMSIPIDLTHTQMVSRVYALPDERREIRALRYLNRRINKSTDMEDRFYMNTIQQGLTSTVFPKWTLSRTAELGVGAFHYEIQEHLPVAKMAHQPKPGTIAIFNDSMIADQTVR